MDSAERDSINAYKTYQIKNLPNVKRISGLWVPNFHKSNYPNLDEISGIKQYLNDLEPYLKVITKASRLRQLHYDNWIKNKTIEDDGHKYWRIELNKIAHDAQEKYAYWKSVHDKLLDDCIKDYQQLYTQMPQYNSSIDISVINTEFVEDKRSNIKTVKNRPRLSDADRKRISNTIKRLKRKKKKEEQQLLDATIKENKSIKKKFVSNLSNIIVVADIIEKWDPKAKRLVPIEGGKFSIPGQKIKGTDSEMRTLIYLYMDAICLLKDNIFNHRDQWVVARHSEFMYIILQMPLRKCIMFILQWIIEAPTLDDLYNVFRMFSTSWATLGLLFDNLSDHNKRTTLNMQYFNENTEKSKIIKDGLLQIFVNTRLIYKIVNILNLYTLKKERLIACVKNNFQIKDFLTPLTKDEKSFRFNQSIYLVNKKLEIAHKNLINNLNID